MSQIPTYSFQEYWSDVRSVNQARAKFDRSLSFDEQVKKHFDSLHGVSELTTWKFGKFMLVNIYTVHHKDALGVGRLGVAGDYDMLVSDKLASRILDYALEHDVQTFYEFPSPDYFIRDVA